MPTAYEWLKFIHVFMAIIAVGFNASYAIWVTRAAKNPEHELYSLRGVKALDDRFANPAYGVLLGTGIWMVLISPLDFTDFWILTALIIFGVTVLLAATGYTPTLRKQIEVLQAEGPASPGYQRLAKRGNAIGIVLGVLVIGIVFLMVTKPSP